MTISSAGIGTGLDVASIISKLVAVESQPITLLNTRQQTYKDQLSAYGRILSATSSLQTAAGKLDSAADFQGYTATVADTDYASATATSYAAAGSYALRVEQLAQANKLLSTANPVVAAGTLTVELGDISGGSFVAKSGSSPVVVNFTGSTLEELRSAINAASAGVSATIVNGSGGKQLVLTSNVSGKENTIKLTGATGLSGLTYDPITPSAAFTEKAAAQDAEAYIDGVLVTSSTNTLSEAMTGVNITLKKAHDPLIPAEATTLTIGSDTAGMTTRAKDFVKSWNDLNTLFKSLTKYDPTASKASTLSGDRTVSSMEAQLRSVLFSSPGGASAAYPRLSDLGITLETDGSLKLDETKFGTALSSNLIDASATVTAFGAAFKTLADNLVGTNGAITSKTASLNSTIKSMDSRRDALQLQVDAIEKRYRAQFTALDAMMGRMQTQSSYLSQQLALLS
ncbi:MAG: flagellar hook-associated protein 2 [Pseudomonadota bacterium]|nr:flagellar hook-associated protein 2 [Pseudomonadota bacterium]